MKETHTSCLVNTQECALFTNKVIGVVGGIGSYAGIDLIKKIYDLTPAACDREHLSVAMLSAPCKIVDRTKYLLGETDVNPGIAIGEIVSTLSLCGARVIGVPCNTAHAASIFCEIRARTPAMCTLVHLVEEVGRFCHDNHPQIKLVGILGTTGTLAAKVYPSVLSKYGIDTLQPSEEIQQCLVHPSIYDSSYGIKSFSHPTTERARRDLLSAATYLARQGAQAVLLACTEIPLAITDTFIEGSRVIDTNLILAQALIRESMNKD